MLRPEFLAILRCPENRTLLALADDDLLAKLNAAIAVGQLKSRAGEVLATALPAALVREDRAMAYPVLGDIPVLLIDAAIPLNQIPLATGANC